jgi:hypothetical protein
MGRSFLSGIGLIAALCAGCTDDPQALTRGNLSAAVERHLKENNPACFSDRCNGFPTTVIRNEQVRKAYQCVLNAYDSLVLAGLLARADSLERRPEGGGYRDYPATVYRLTAEGQQFYDAKRHMFCYGEARLDRILSYHERPGAAGQPTVAVRYAYRVENIARWAESGALSEHFPEIGRGIASRETPIEAEVLLVRGPAGWKVAGRP